MCLNVANDDESCRWLSYESYSCWYISYSSLFFVVSRSFHTFYIYFCSFIGVQLMKRWCCRISIREWHSLRCLCIILHSLLSSRLADCQPGSAQPEQATLSSHSQFSVTSHTAPHNNIFTCSCHTRMIDQNVVISDSNYDVWLFVLRGFWFMLNVMRLWWMDDHNLDLPWMFL